MDAFITNFTNGDYVKDFSYHKKHEINAKLS